MAYGTVNADVIGTSITGKRALESGADTSVIVAEKQRLRDITKLSDEATTLDELKGITL